jgi:hypothetical protein
LGKYNLEERDNLLRRIVEVTTAMIEGDKSFIVGARALYGLTSAPHVRDIIDSRIWAAIDSETDALPVGPERDHWELEALAKLTGKIQRAENWARDFGLQECIALREFCLSKIGDLDP